jgi:DNA mismatch repair protein MutS
MMRQFEEIKKQHPEAILFFRLGDFYEMFGSDAELASRELDLVLTGRGAGDAGKIPMAGFPHHAAEGYITRLVEKGYRVAICEQMEDPKLVKGIVKREVVRIITPGTVLNGQALPEKQNNYLIAVVPGRLIKKKGRSEEKWDGGDQDQDPPETGFNSFGLAVIEASTGEFLATEFRDELVLERLLDEVARINPAEILIADTSVFSIIQASLSKHSATMLTRFSALENLDLRDARQRLTSHFNTVSLDGFGCANLSEGLIAAAGLLQYLKETQKTIPIHIERIKPYSTKDFMILDGSTRRNLELTASLNQHNRKGSLLGVLDKTVTSMGGRMLRTWIDQPLLDITCIKQRLDNLEVLVKNFFVRTKLRDLLNGVYDLERLFGRVAYGTANARDLIGLKASIQMAVPIREVLTEMPAGDLGYLGELLGQLDPLEDVVTIIEEAITMEPPISVREGGIIQTGYDPEVDRLRDAAGGGKQWIASLEAREKTRTGIKSLKVGYNKVFGYYLEATNANLSLIPADYLRKQTLANGERYITPELKEYEALVLGAEDQLKEVEYQLFLKVRERIAQEGTRILQTARVLAQLDVLAALAEVAVENDYCKPEMDQGTSLLIKDARHPVVEKNLLDQAFVPNDVVFHIPDDAFKIITGPNMGGKSTYCRSVALICLMAQIGSFVPAREAQIGLVDRIFARIGASDDLGSGQSTFMVEMNEVGNIVNSATGRSLVILDEVGRGTSTYDGLSIAWALTEFIHNRIGARTLFATHYHELIEMEKHLSGVRNCNMAVREQGEEIVFLRRVLPGGVDRSYGIQVARLAGLPGELIQRAREILQELEQRETSHSKVSISVNTSTLTGNVKTGKAANLPDNADVNSEGRQRKAAASSPTQLSLLGWESHPVVEEIRSMDLMKITPIEALTRLYEIQQRLKRDA